MVDRIPSGTRDVLPDEMRELRAMTDRIRAVFERFGYGEVYTPALEYESALGGAWTGLTAPAYRVFDEQGNVLVLRTDMTIPIARLVSTRYPNADPPLRFCYFAHAYRGVRPQRGQSRELLQAGVELIGSPAPEGTAEALNVMCAALDAAGLENYRVGVGDASLYPGLLETMGVTAEARERILQALVDGDFVGVEREVRTTGVSDAEAELLLRVPTIRGGPEVLANLSRSARGGRDGDAGNPRAAGATGRGAGDLRSRAGSEPGLLHGRGVPGVRPGPRRTDRQRRALRRAARTVRPAAAGGRVRAQHRTAAHRADRRGARAHPPGPAVNDLHIAVPRGALLHETLDLLDGLGLDTREVRENDRKLLFEQAGIITMRPSDVPTYVEAGAADLGITGKDVLMEQSEREVYELVDLGYGHCTMVLATVAGEDLAAEALPTARRHADRDQVPEDRGSALPRDGPPGGDRRGQGVG